MKYIFNCQIFNLDINNEQISKLINSDQELDFTEIKEKIVTHFNTLMNFTYNEIKTIDNENLRNELLILYEKLNLNEKDISRDEAEKILKSYFSQIRQNLTPFVFSDYLNILMSNGCSTIAGSKTINNEIGNDFSDVLKKYSSKYTIKDIIHNLNGSPEKVLDKLYQIKNYFENILEDEKETEKLTKIIIEYRTLLLKSYVLGIDYSKTEIHKNFLMKLLELKNKQITLYTLNYDILIEKAAEELNIQLNNGFNGFHIRKFNPANFNYKYYVETAGNEKIITKCINLVKLHGSLSWQYSDKEVLYNIIEKQFDLTKTNQINFNEIINEAIIYPVQTKKTHTLDLPYSEMFRQFNEYLGKKNSTLLIIGYSFLDEHVNDIINNALSNPYFNIVIFAYSSLEQIENNKSSELYKFYEKAKKDKRISIFPGKILGNFETIVNDLFPVETPKNLITELEALIKKELK